MPNLARPFGIITATQTEISGPIPDPKVLAEYGKVDSSFPERIMQMAEREQRFDHDQYRFLASGLVRSIHIGQGMIGFICLTGLICGTLVIIYADSALVGTLINVLAFIVPGVSQWLRERSRKEPAADKRLKQDASKNNESQPDVGKEGS
ncbi:MAG: hypothetical protein AMXMBFR84_25850 [Candidatus Hydrogenedentota bacterium]